MARVRRRATKKAKGRVRSAPVANFSGDQPTPEQRRQRPYEIEPLVDEGQVRGRTFRRQPLYVTLSNTSSPLTPAAASCARPLPRDLRRAHRSYTASCLDPDRRHWTPDSILHVTTAVRHARETMAEAERRLGVAYLGARVQKRSPSEPAEPH